MSFDRLMLVPLAAGHVALFVVAINVVHAFGCREQFMRWVKFGLLASSIALASRVAWAAWTGPIGEWPPAILAYAGLCLFVGLVAVPLSSLHLRLRPRPERISERAVEIDFAETIGRDQLIGKGKYDWMLALPGNESFRLRKTEWELVLPSLPAALDGLSILHISDLHFAPCFRRRYFEAVIDEAAGWECDLVLFTGDLVDHDSAHGWIVPLMSRLGGRLGSFAVFGNHDLDHDPAGLRRLMIEAGYADLEGRWATVEHASTTIALGGTSDPWGPPLSIGEQPDADYRILLSHSPDQFYWAARHGFDLMLSGHNHGGQVRLPAIGAVFMPSRYSRRFDRGFFRKGGLTLHVSQGVAGKHPVRYGCVPEIGRLVLRSTEKRQELQLARRTDDLTLSSDAAR
jgi:predicted MPP superfamily phosphohydrolase